MSTHKQMRVGRREERDGGGGRRVRAQRRVGGRRGRRAAGVARHAVYERPDRRAVELCVQIPQFGIHLQVEEDIFTYYLYIEPAITAAL